MSTQVTLTMTNGQVVSAVSYRMSPYSVPTASTPASPIPFDGGQYHVQTPYGWVDIAAGDVHAITVTGGANT